MSEWDANGTFEWDCSEDIIKYNNIPEMRRGIFFIT